MLPFSKPEIGAPGRMLIVPAATCSSLVTDLVDRRVRSIREERARLTAELRDRGFELTDSHANFVWAAHPALEGGELAQRVARAGVLVAAGAALGEPHHVRISVRHSAASQRLLDAIDKAL